MTEERRTRTLTDEDIAALTAAMHGGMTPDEHADHHQTFRTWIERENRKAEFREKIKAQVGGWGVVAALSGIGYAAWEGFKGIVKMKGGA
jgi:hypothetical protein